MTRSSLTIFYDAQCPLCNLEMQKLKDQDTAGLIILWICTRRTSNSNFRMSIELKRLRSSTANIRVSL